MEYSINTSINIVYIIFTYENRRRLLLVTPVPEPRFRSRAQQDLPRTTTSAEDMDGTLQYMTKRQIEQTMEAVLAPAGIYAQPGGVAIPAAAMQLDQGPAPKRYKAEDVLGDQNGLKIATRIVMNRADMSKVIGKGGANIALIRTNCGAFVKGNFSSMHTHMSLSP